MRLLLEAYVVGSSMCAPQNTPDRLVTPCYLQCVATLPDSKAWTQIFPSLQVKLTSPDLFSCSDCYDVDLTRRFWYNLEPGTRWSLWVRLACVTLLLMLLCLLASSKEFAAKCRMIVPYSANMIQYVPIEGYFKDLQGLTSRENWIHSPAGVDCL